LYKGPKTKPDNNGTNKGSQGDVNQSNKRKLDEQSSEDNKKAKVVGETTLDSCIQEVLSKGPLSLKKVLKKVNKTFPAGTLRLFIFAYVMSDNFFTIAIYFYMSQYYFILLVVFCQACIQIASSLPFHMYQSQMIDLCTCLFVCLFVCLLID
jgi:hypothetical protein